MKITSGILAVAAASGALLAATAPAHANDVLNLVNVKRVPVSVLSEGNTSADNIQITSVEQTGHGSDDGEYPEEYHHGFGLLGLAPLLENALHPNTIYDGQNNGFVMETVERNVN
ncbi:MULTISPECIES: hypothetical protein [unclassified Streptomyces]|uniref:hypothetical protein n=1 Tax=unclassified Streptomyces TaxID=2593676 RepID=UPI003654CCDB